MKKRTQKLAALFLTGILTTVIAAGCGGGGSSSDSGTDTSTAESTETDSEGTAEVEATAAKNSGLVTAKPWVAEEPADWPEP